MVSGRDYAMPSDIYSMSLTLYNKAIDDSSLDDIAILGLVYYPLVLASRHPPASLQWAEEFLDS